MRKEARAAYEYQNFHPRERRYNILNNSIRLIPVSRSTVVLKWPPVHKV